MVIFCILSLALLQSRYKVTEDIIHIGVKIYINNEFQDYSDTDMNSVMVCRGSVYSILDNTRIITWKDLLNVLGFDYHKYPSVAIINGENIGDYLDKDVKNQDSIVIIAGEYNDFSELKNSAVIDTQIQNNCRIDN